MQFRETPANDQGLLHGDHCFDAPADASLLRAVATDIEEPDSGYVFGGITGARLRKLARAIEQPAIAQLIDTLDARRVDEIELRFVREPTGSFPAVSLADGETLLAAIVATEHTRGAQ